MKIVSLFSGAGGLDLGFIQAGHEVVWANDNDEDCVKTYQKNIGNNIVLGDIATVSSSQIPDCEMVIGGFPCQGFSVANIGRRPGDARNRLYKEFLRVLKDKAPKFFVAENVKGILSLDKGEVFKKVIKDFGEAGYRVKYAVLNAADYGVPQKRERVVIFGVRKDLNADVSFPIPTHRGPRISDSSLKPWVTVGEALADIPEPIENAKLPNHTYSKYKLRFNGYLGHRKINPDKPAPTVTARGDDRGGVVVMHHPKNHRRMSARELATVQSFPLEFEFCGCQSSAYRQIGNAVPPLLAHAVASVYQMI